MEIASFTPGKPTLPGPPLAPYRHVASAGALGPYLDTYTQPDDLVIDLFCQGPTIIHEAVQAGRRALGLNVNRAILLAASLGLAAVERRAVEAAFTQLAEARKGPRTLQAHIDGLYGTTCVNCGTRTIAEAFIWERESNTPVQKRYRCTACDDAGETPVEVPTNEADRAAAADFENRGLSYWLLLDRAAAGDAPHRGRIASLLDLYTPRNLSAVNDLLLKSDRLAVTPAVRCVLDVLLLDTFDWATSLRPPDPSAARPRRLQHPARYVEANVWRVFERALETWLDIAPVSVPQAPSLEALLAADASGIPAAAPSGSAYVAALSTGQARRELPPDCAALVVADPPRPDTVLWHLSALWCHWLWGSSAGAPLISLLNRRWLDKDWLWRGLRGAFRAVSPLLRPGGRLICVFADENPVILEALTLAAAGAGYELSGWGAQPSGEARLTWRGARRGAGTPPVEEMPPSTVADPLSRAVAERAVDISLHVLRARGEPVDWRTLHAAIYAGLAESGLLAQVATLPDDADSDAVPASVTQPLSWLADTIRSALDGAPLRQVSGPRTRGIKERDSAPLWWLGADLEREAAAPLSDRVELAVAEILRDLLAVTDTDLHRRVCARFPGPQTPDAHLIQLCLFSYGDQHAPGHWRLRSEDEAEVRAVETDAVIADLTSLGQRLGFKVTRGTPGAREWAVCWRDETGHTSYVFAVRTTAVLGDLLFDPPPRLFPADAERDVGDNVDAKTTPCLTFPGGRSVLVGYKLGHDSRMRQQVDQRGWQFLKFRHLRHLVQEVAAKQLDRYAFQAALGLDPIVEQEEAQLSLW